MFDEDAPTRHVPAPLLVTVPLVFDRQGYLYMTVGCCSTGKDQEAQNPSSALGKVIRLREDGTVPTDNPFVGQAGYRPEIFTMGHRNALGLATNPATGDIWENENGPQGGDEINILKAGKNYGWPLASEGRDYNGTLFPTHAEVPGLERPFMIWVPAIAISGMMFYTGDAFPNGEPILLAAMALMFVLVAVRIFRRELTTRN